MSPTTDTVTRISGTGVGVGVGSGVGSGVNTALCEDTGIVDCVEESDIEGLDSDVISQPVESRTIHPKRAIINNAVDATDNRLIIG
jgi:hypothetical protein